MRAPHRPLAMTVALLLGAGLLAGCSEKKEPEAAEAPATAPPATASTKPGGTSSPAARIGTPAVAGTIARDLEVPWGLAFLPGGDALVAERDTAKIKRVTADGKVTVVGTVPDVDPAGEGGLLGLAVSPTFATDRFVYAYFTANEDNRIVRMPYAEDRLGRPEPVLDRIPKGNIHNGGRIKFGPDGMLWAGTGESGDKPLAQDRASLGGKILRMTPAGKPAPGNPFPNSVVYSYGHRNVQGLAWDSAGRLWASEFGQREWDELNLIRAGANYGWPEFEGKGGTGSGYVDPLLQWRTDDASPSGLAVAGGAAYMAGLRGARLWQIPLNGERVGAPKAYFTGELGRLRTVEVAPDGSLWLTTSNTDGRGEPKPGDDKILRIALR